MTAADAHMLRDFLTDALNIPGHVVTIGKATYTRHEVEFKVVIAPLGEGGKLPLSKEARDFIARAESYGLKPDDLGRVFSYGGDQYKIVGCVPSRPKMPIQTIRLSNGRGWKWSANTVRLCLLKVNEEYELGKK